MKNLKLFFLLLLLSQCIFMNANAQSVIIKMKRPPLNQLGIADLYNIELANTSNNSIEFYLIGTLTESKAGLIATATTIPITLAPKERRQFKASDLSRTPDISYPNSDGRYKEALLRKGSLPDGNYTICVTAKQTGTNEELGNDCIEQEITVQNEIQITLLIPDNKSEIMKDEPVSFSWTSMGGKGEGPYKIKIIEIIRDESPENAMLKNKAFFEKEGIKTTMLQYPSSAPKFTTGKTYIWQVSTNNAKSEIFSFNTRDGEPSDNCINNIVNISTGWDHNTNQTYNNLGTDQDVFWTLVTAPTNSGTVNIGGPVWVIQNHFAWQPPASGSQWISAFQIPGSNEANMTTNFSPYIYRKKICVQELSNLDFAMQVLVDNKADIRFVDATGNVIDNIGTATGFGSPTQLTKTVMNVAPGNYFLQIEHRNDNTGSPMGVNLQGTVTSNTAVFNNIICCSPPGSTITGYKFHDINNNGIQDNTDSVMQGWTIQLTGNGISDTSVTDANGNYLFTNLPQGTYTVTEVMQTGWAAGVTGNQHIVTIGSNTSVNNIAFGNIKYTDSCGSFNAAANSIPGECCWSINLTTPANTTGINQIQFLALSPNTFASKQLINPTGWLFPVNNGQEFKIRRSSNNIPAGQLNNFVNFCMNKLSSPQYIVVNLLRNDNSIVCSDTVILNCDIPCVTITKDTVLCNGNNYDLNFTFTNNASFPINKVEVVNTIPAGITANPSVLTYLTTVNPGQTSNPPASFSLNGVMPGTSPCVILKFTSPDGCCWCYDTVCVDIPSCVCNDVGANISASDQVNCCFGINIQNNHSGNYFTGVNIRTLEAGVSFSTWITNYTSDWYSSNYSPASEIKLVNISNGFVPQGISANVVTFCLTGYTTSTQHILVEWMRNDSIVCTDTLITNCVPPPPVTSCTQIINDSLICLPDGTYQYTFSIKNNSTHTTTGFQFNSISPSTLTFTPANFENVTIQPGMVSAPQTMIISGVNPGAQICFNISLYEHVLQNNQQYYDWCCYSDEICLLAPVCSTGNNCQCIEWETSEIEVFINGSPKSPLQCNQVLNVSLNSLVKLQFSEYLCGVNCRGDRSWDLTGGSGVAPIYVTGTTNPIQYNFNTPGTYNLTYRGICNGRVCDSCIIRINVTSNPTGCNCEKGKWNLSENIIRYSLKGISKDKQIKCSDTYTIDANSAISLFPAYNCGQANCNAKYTYKINNGVMTGFQTSPYNILNINSPTTVMIYAWCGEKICDSCVVYLKPNANTGCDCGGWEGDKPGITIHGFNGGPKEELEEFIKCDGIYKSIVRGSYLDLVSQTYYCKPKDCKASYEWVITSPSGTTSSFGTQTINSFQFNQKGTYSIYLRVFCNGKLCGECKTQISVKGNASDPK